MRALGNAYEDQATDLLTQHGLRILARNVSSKSGEIDIVALDGEQLVFVEVRARGNPRFASAAGSVDKRKQRRIIRTAQGFLQRQQALALLPCRFDVITFEPPQSGVQHRVHWIRAAFTA